MKKLFLFTILILQLLLFLSSIEEIDNKYPLIGVYITFPTYSNEELYTEVLKNIDLLKNWGIVFVINDNLQGELYPKAKHIKNYDIIVVEGESDGVLMSYFSELIKNHKIKNKIFVLDYCYSCYAPNYKDNKNLFLCSFGLVPYQGFRNLFLYAKPYQLYNVNFIKYLIAKEYRSLRKPKHFKVDDIFLGTLEELYKEVKLRTQLKCNQIQNL